MTASNIKNGRGCVHLLKNIILAILSLLLVFFVITGVVGYNIWRIFFNPPLVKQIVGNEILKSELIPVLLEDFSMRRAEERVSKNESLSGVSEPDIPLLLSYMSLDSWRQIRDIILQPDFVNNLISVTMDGLYKWLDSRDPFPQIVWDLSSLKTQLVGQDGKQVVMIAYLSMPTCSQDEVNDLKARLANVPPGVEVLYNLCQFPAPWQDDQIGDYTNALAEVNQNIPNEFNFSQMLEQSQGNANKPMQSLKNFLIFLRFFGLWGWIFAFILLVLVVGIGVRSFRSLGKWVGIPLLISGVVLLVIYFLLRFLLSMLLQISIHSVTSQLVFDAVNNSLMYLTGLIFQPILPEGIIITIVGLVMIVLMFAINPRVKKTSLKLQS
jgi:hypothetical protein